jgi:uncharacterized protein (DUF111 family)
VTTAWGTIRLKVATLPDGDQRAAPEYEDCRRLSEDRDVPLQVLYDAAINAWQARGGT